ncbi:(2Fe-2S)-binding protein [Aquimarina sp. AD10]|uniref:(2Fe-2S)-binding protein n=1 Tax=Aquimarina aggregata TaxID=1642818 RepID=A0A163C2W2_9FLAO|nr:MULTISPECIES: (2Fe-2S)-binding protein [Aquimarina]AXT60000.1 (2Fe-2S)-binding protein [Aquimarina sp. AD10]KZS42010.1 (2Fe-2S)-binding protein [Aquimarina aggregata]RKM93800.1 (2Fe-2S)-binding protein [Aquimarina sp. AD10]
MPVYNLKINGKAHAIEADQDTPLLWVLRDHLDMVGTKFGCGIGQCGACTVHIDGSATRSCLLQVSMIEDSEITTIEGISEDGTHPVQQAWKEIDVPQCGYCQAGQIMSATAFLNEKKNPNRSEIRDAMSGNICRCASYNRIEKAVELAASKMS